MEKTIFYLNDEQTHFLEVEFEWFTEDETWHDWPEICAASLNGLMGIKLDEMPKELKNDIVKQIYNEQR
jgi:hypothetical protein